MGYEVTDGPNGRVIGVLKTDGGIEYKESVDIKEMVAGQGGGKSTSISTNARVVYRFDSNRIANNDAIYKMWKNNPLMQNRIIQLNALIFGRRLNYSCDESIAPIVDRFWKINRLRQYLKTISTDSQLYGEVFIGLYPQKTGDVLVSVYESNQVQIDFDPTNANKVNKYIIQYKNEESGKDEVIDMMPLHDYLNALEFSGPISAVGRKVDRMINGTRAGIKGKGVMVHVKFNNSSSEIHGTSDFRQVFTSVENYMYFIQDRLNIHHIYGSPAFDIEIDTDDDGVIEKRVEELAGFTIGSNPVHNKKEIWKPLEFKHSGASMVEADEKTLRGLVSAGMSFPEHLLFNQPATEQSDDMTFALTKLAEERQDAFKTVLTDIHKFAVAVAGGDISLITENDIIFPEITTMSEKTKAETYVLKVGANICSRKTAALNTGHNWEEEMVQMEEEMDIFGRPADDPALGGVISGRFTNRLNNQDPNRDTGSSRKNLRKKTLDGSQSQVVSGGKAKNE